MSGEAAGSREAPGTQPSSAPAVRDGARPHVSAASRLSETIGNRAFSSVLARMGDGDGILAGGRIHPDVEGAIAASRGGGRALDHDLRSTLARHYADELDDVRVHTGAQADALARAVSARAFTVGSDVFFAAGEYGPHTRGGRDLIAHEVAHVVQNRGAPAAGPLTVTTPGDALERQADAAARGAVA